MKYLLATLLFLLTTLSFAGGNHHQHNLDLTVTPVFTETFNTTETTNYQYDKCQGKAMAMATGNNQMHIGTLKPQVSIGVGECDGDVAGSLMFGMKPCSNCPMLNGSWGFDEDVNAFGLGANFIFK